MFQFEGFTLDVRRSSLRAADRDIELRPKTFEVLCYLVENADRMVTKEELIKAIWPNVVVTEESLTHCVSEARQAIRDGEQMIIKTVPRLSVCCAGLTRRVGWRVRVTLGDRSGAGRGSEFRYQLAESVIT